MDENEKKEQPILRSINNEQESLVTFINNTEHDVVLYWIDYEGRAVSYGILDSNDYMEVDTYVTHPWIFVDEETRDRYTVNQKDVFFPPPWGDGCYNEEESFYDPERFSVYISIPLYTLREAAMRVIRRRLTHAAQAFELDIPSRLQYELAKKLPKTSSILQKVRTLRELRALCGFEEDMY